MIKLGVNIDHVATIRQARMTYEPDPVWAAAMCELAGADAITVHLREDRRHIQDRDVEILRKTVKTKLNLEMANIKSIVEIALKIKPDQVTIVPEKREEITTEGGLEVTRNLRALADSVKLFHSQGITTSLFIDPEVDQINSAAKTKTDFVEFHTGKYANSSSEKDMETELNLLIQAANLAHRLGLRVNAGHGLNYSNVKNICKLPYLEELNIGHSIISRAVFVGLIQSVKEMKELLR